MEPEEFLRAYDKYADAIFRHCYFRLSDRELAQDTAQETFTRTWKYIADGGDVKNIRAFLYRVAHNLIIDEWKRKKAVSLEELAEKGFDPKDDNNVDLANVFDAREAAKVLELLDKPYREVVVMRYIDDMSPKEIARILGETENTISVRIHRALKKAKELLNHE
ncbi:MAG: hypothetical protein A3F26_03185 [Candidatus Ryanbacteria bacterium RIFCSPHIGHO2_12_FULL_47_12b]|uniref:RNA polymerase sigma factor n=2 Tax=Candidatus Ryaniibacteriota TaxID=1817914 RepID=A0A1G2H3B1_9BACT|nr:MAG: RNA polymerase, sigma-24 subunit, ECF subfamily [Parcubacteria group bacterium GW2011_GWA2_47_10b]KKU85650.1 MAG: RNA polymerase, sigma-24 subunit, ECF subfamily [Parcubacteria group bacterium GW2011_GWA1_47_9]OGZ46401.1 MAG: hypothetical protein A2844_01480 [Candidatus Ryanbacteria bacterium RIFCSPHIGHO2_01_FULL_48_80]OGZ49634.1 MAG: hypothetical protein A3C83_01185 [Candidatus Ryanbacteria bacterium RIFCSPHIGHO2_02_FULL_47_25]OGZ52305.1 MAG: hypothetical protein A3F26_03185 [Candidatu